MPPSTNSHLDDMSLDRGRFRFLTSAARWDVSVSTSCGPSSRNVAGKQLKKKKDTLHNCAFLNHIIPVSQLLFWADNLKIFPLPLRGFWSQCLAADSAVEPTLFSSGVSFIYFSGGSEESPPGPGWGWNPDLTLHHKCLHFARESNPEELLRFGQQLTPSSSRRVADGADQASQRVHRITTPLYVCRGPLNAQILLYPNHSVWGLLVTRRPGRTGQLKYVVKANWEQWSPCSLLGKLSE